MHLVLDGLDMIEMLLDVGQLTIHPRCTKVIDAFNNYAKKRRSGGEFIDEPADEHPHEDMMDALRGGIRDAMPSGRPAQSSLRPIHASRIV